MKIYSEHIKTKLGYWKVKANSTHILKVSFDTKPEIEADLPNKLTNRATKQLKEYFFEGRKDFDLPLAVSSYSEFYQAVWQQVAQIPFGKTASYSEIALKINNPKAVRAVGMANGKNPFPLVIPCHRIIGRSGHLTGYASGLTIKKWLLTHEGVLAETPTLF